MVEQGKKASWFCPPGRSFINVLERVLAHGFPGGCGGVHGVPGGHATFPHRQLAEVGAVPSARVQIKWCCLLCLGARLSGTVTRPVV